MSTPIKFIFVGEHKDELRQLRNEILSFRHFLEQRMATFQEQLDQLLGAVTDQSGKIDSMRTFIAGLEQQIKDALSGENITPESQAKLDQVFAGLENNTQQIVNAIDNDPNT